jgi:hypothetical protein
MNQSGVDHDDVSRRKGAVGGGGKHTDSHTDSGWRLMSNWLRFIHLLNLFIFFLLSSRVLIMQSPHNVAGCLVLNCVAPK